MLPEPNPAGADLQAPWGAGEAQTKPFIHLNLSFLICTSRGSDAALGAVVRMKGERAGGVGPRTRVHGLEGL